MKSTSHAQLVVRVFLLSLIVMQTACTTPPPPAPIVVPVDSDLDGVVDSLDRCPHTPVGVVVDAIGCPVVVDKDGDGVIDTQDACPNTLAGKVVDAQGCPVVLPPPTLTIHLEYLPNTSEVSSTFAPQMEKIADFVRGNPGRRFVVEGHTDSVGNDADNMKLSLLRAEKIKAYLIEKMGVPACSLEAQGFGESRPVADNATQAGRQLNRRVVVLALPE